MKKRIAWATLWAVIMAFLVIVQHVYHKLNPEEGVVRLEAKKPPEAE
jgi:hypothetical protein